MKQHAAEEREEPEPLRSPGERPAIGSAKKAKKSRTVLTSTSSEPTIAARAPDARRRQRVVHAEREVHEPGGTSGRCAAN